ncbi:MAG: cyclase family protein [Bryobacteraceae bacterium]
MQPLDEAIAGARVFDLAQPYFPGMPHHPSHPPFLFGLVKQHGDYVGPAGNSSAADALALGSHVGTHIDALCHFSCGGKLYGGVEAASAQSHQRGLNAHSIDTVPPIVRRGVLLDAARHAGMDALPADFEITPEHLDQIARAQNLEVRRGDVVLLRTGWARYFHDAARFVSEVRGPGPARPGAEWLSRRGIFAAGSDTLAFEKMPDAAMPVHVHLLVESGIHILECLNLEELAAASAWTFLLVAAPLKIRGATGAPVRPLAIVPPLSQGTT